MLPIVQNEIRPDKKNYNYVLKGIKSKNIPSTFKSGFYLKTDESLELYPITSLVQNGLKGVE